MNPLKEAIKYSSHADDLSKCGVYLYLGESYFIQVLILLIIILINLVCNTKHRNVNCYISF